MKIIVFLILSILQFNSNDINNLSSVKDADIIIELALDKLNIHDQTIYIHDLTPRIENLFYKDGNINGFITESELGHINIFIKPKLSERKIIETLAHESIHIHQIVNGRLDNSEFPIVYFDEEPFNIHRTPYWRRSWELEAYKQEGDIEKHIRNFLIN